MLCGRLPTSNSETSCARASLDEPHALRVRPAANRRMLRRYRLRRACRIPAQPLARSVKRSRLSVNRRQGHARAFHQRWQREDLPRLSQADVEVVEIILARGASLSWAALGNSRPPGLVALSLEHPLQLPRRASFEVCFAVGLPCLQITSSAPGVGGGEVDRGSSKLRTVAVFVAIVALVALYVLERYLSAGFAKDFSSA